MKISQKKIYKHETHFACDERLAKYGGKTVGCCCVNHKCKEKQNKKVEKTLKELKERGQKPYMYVRIKKSIRQFHYTYRLLSESEIKQIPNRYWIDDLPPDPQTYQQALQDVLAVMSKEKKDKRIPYQALYFTRCENCEQEYNADWINMIFKKIRIETIDTIREEIKKLMKL